jgi:hypothetical protein
MEHTAKIFITTSMAALLIAALAASPQHAVAADPPAQGAAGALAQGYTERWTFNIAGKSIGTQSAILTKIDNGLQTWAFRINLVVPANGQSVTLKQTGRFVVDSSGHPVSLDTTAVTNGVSQGEKITFGNGSATVDLDPPIAAVAHSFPVPDHPYLLINNLMTLVSLATRATHASASAEYVLPTFSANALRPADIKLTPVGPAPGSAKPCHVFDATITATGLPSSVNEYWLSDTTGELVRCIDKNQSLVIVRY